MQNLSILSQKAGKQIDRLNDRLTSYRLVLYVLLGLLAWAVLGSFFNQIPYSWNDVLVSAAFLAAVCWATNKLISRLLDIPANKESYLITALILSLILAPAKTTHDFSFLAVAAIVAITSKYVITLYNSHLFNPAAAGAFVVGEVFHKYPAWWVGTKFMSIIVVLGGVLILRKMKRFTMVGAFLAVYILYLIYGTGSGGNLHYIWSSLISTQVLFFAIIMLTEPLTSPTTQDKYLPYAVLVGLLYSITRLGISPEEALLIGNLFTFALARNHRYKLRFVRKVKEAEGIYSYIFEKPANFKFKAGQYMEWTLARNKTDSRGNRRYLTISSAPSESELMFTIKRPNPASAFKTRLDELKAGEPILASHLAGNFILPKDPSKKIALLAGGVGITPFRSMLHQEMKDRQQRDVALIYSVNSNGEIAFSDLFKQGAEAEIKASYIVGERLSEAKLKSLLPDFKQRTFYISGPYSFVNSAKESLLRLGVGGSHIVTDYFPGYGG